MFKLELPVGDKSEPQVTKWNTEEAVYPQSRTNMRVGYKLPERHEGEDYNNH